MSSRVGFLIAGDTYRVKGALNSMYWKWIAEIKCYAKISGICEDHQKTLREECISLCKSYQGLQWKEVSGDAIIKYFPKEHSRDQANAMPYTISEEVVGQRQFNDSLEQHYKVGTKVYMFFIEFNDSDLVRASNTMLWSMYDKTASLSQRIKIKDAKFRWDTDLKCWITCSAEAKTLLEEKLQKKYETYIMDKVLKDAFTTVND